MIPGIVSTGEFGTAFVANREHNIKYKRECSNQFVHRSRDMERQTLCSVTIPIPLTGIYCSGNLKPETYKMFSKCCGTH